MLDATDEPSSSQPSGSTALSIPFVQIDAARVAGAVLHPVSGLWYAPHGADLAPLQQWMTHAMPVHADKTLEPSSGAAEAAYVQNAEMLSYAWAVG